MTHFVVDFVYIQTTNREITIQSCDETCKQKNVKSQNGDKQYKAVITIQSEI